MNQAGRCFRRAMRLDRGNWLSRYHWGVALHRAGELTQALRWLRGALRLRPAERRIHQRLGMCHYDQGAFDEALRCYRRALEQPERDVADAELYVAIGCAEAERGERDAAERAFERACLLAPDDAEVYFRWAVLCARHGEAEDAARLAARARALDRRSLRSALLLVTLALDAGDWARAAAQIEELRASPASSRLAVALSAEVERRRGDASAARALALQALASDGPPSDHAVDTALETLRRLRGDLARCRGFRLLVEGECGEQAYYRPYVVLAADEDQARWFVAELQDALGGEPWRIVEAETFQQEGEALAGVYQLLLTRVLFPREE
jgi:tetratricopeptide (TPR) repeat protein